MKNFYFLAAALFALQGSVNAQCEPVPTPHFEGAGTAIVPALPECYTSTYLTFGSQRIWETAAAPVTGFIGNVFAFNTSGQTVTGATLYTRNYQLVAGVEYTVTYRAGLSSNSTNIALDISAGGAGGWVNIQSQQLVSAATNYVSASFTVTETGGYSINFGVTPPVNQGWIYLDDIMVTEASAMGVAASTVENVQLYPNPVDQELFISGETPEFIAIYALTGQEVYKAEKSLSSVSINVAHLQPGMYMVHLNYGDRQEKKKLVKK